MKIKSILGYLLSFLLITLVLAVSLKGVGGNPTPSDIYLNLQSESMPFELSPERGRYALTQSIAENKSVYFSEEIARYVIPDLGFSNGHFVSLFAPGVSYLALPFYLLGRTVNLAQVITFASSSFFALLNVLLIALIVKKITSNKYAGIVAGLVFLFASSAFSYSLTLYQHQMTTFFLLINIYILSGNINAINSFLFGAFYAAGFFIEYPAPIFQLPLLIYFLYRCIEVGKSTKKVSVRIKFYPVFAFILFIVFMLPSLFYNKIAYGSPTQLAGTVQNVRSIDIANQGPDTGIVSNNNVQPNPSPFSFFKTENITKSLNILLISSERGILIYSPVFLLGLLFFTFIKSYNTKNKNIAIAVFYTSLAILSLYSMWGDPWGGWAFGPRYLIPFVACLSVLLGLSIDKYGKKFWFIFTFFVLSLYSLFVNIPGGLTTNAIPPTREHYSLSYPAVKYLYNISLIRAGKTSSFVFNNFFNHYLTLEQFTLIIGILILLLIALNYLLAQKKYDEAGSKK